MGFMKGFTLIELMLIMGVIAFAMALSIVGLTRFRANIELNTIHTNIISMINDMKNKSTNASSESSNGVLTIVDMFGIMTGSGDVYPMQCDGNSDFTIYSCITPSDISRIILGSVRLSGGTCPTRIGFKRLTSDLVTISSTGGVSNTGTCTVLLQHSFTNETKTITIDLVRNSYK
jgi:type II secretory pathway pseudopilin PulG